MIKKTIFVFLVCINTMVSAKVKLGQVGFLPFNIGPALADDNKINLDVNLDIAYFTCFFAGKYDIETGYIPIGGLGFGFAPVNYQYAFHNSYWSFINFQLFWNITKSETMIGPFASINYGPNLKFKNYNHILSYGIRLNSEHFYGKNDWSEYALNIEGGIRTIDNKNHLYFNIGMDIMFVIALFALAWIW